MNEVIARLELLGKRANEEPFPIIAEIGRPYRINETDDTEYWKCPVSMRPLFPKLMEIAGEDSFQSLCLGIRLVASLLSDFKEKGGRLLGDSDCEFPLQAYFSPGEKKPDGSIPF